MSGDDHINLKVTSQEGNEVFFRIKRSTQFEKLMNAYCDRQSVEMSSIVFLFDGRCLRADQTPDELEMEDGDEIDAEAAQQYLGERLQAVVLQEQDPINLKVKSQEGNEVFFRIKRSTQFKKLMIAYCDRQSVKMNSIAFLFDGRRLRADQTPDELEMEDGETLQATQLEAHVRVLEERLDQSKALVAELEARGRALEERLKPSGGNH